MKFIQKQLGKYEVRHENNHFCGHIEWSYTWECFYFSPKQCRLSFKDCKEISKFMNKLNRKFR